MCIIRRTMRGIALGTSISVAHSSGTSWNPGLRAARAGNSAVRSGVAVKMTLMTSSVLSSLRPITSVTSSVVAARISAWSFALTWTAPRTARTVTVTPPFAWVQPTRGELRLRSQADGSVQVADLLGGQSPGGTGAQRSERDGSDLGSDQPAHRTAAGCKHPLDDVLTAFVQRNLHQGPVAHLLHHAELICAGHADLE